MQIINQPKIIGLACAAFLAALSTWAQSDSRSPPGGPLGPENREPSNILRPGPETPPSVPALKNPYSGNPEAIREGEELYSRYNCVGCHMPEGGGGIGPPLSDEQWIYGGDAASIFNSIWQGRPEGMPTYAGRITEDELWKLIAYVQSLQNKTEDPRPSENE